MRQWSEEQPEADRKWFAESNTLVLLEAPDEAALAGIMDRARQKGVPCAEFLVPDMGGELTAFAIGPTGAGLVAQLPLALRERKGGLAP